MLSQTPLYVVLLIAAAIAFARVHLRVKTTLTGYEIGRLKAAEGRLLAEKSELSVELARLTGRESLDTHAGEELQPSTGQAEGGTP
ncbi:MAG: hypothetical protein RIQ81_2424 [Pseudomonadota bacterium]|jgi:hypothetical protein